MTDIVLEEIENNEKHRVWISIAKEEFDKPNWDGKGNTLKQLIKADKDNVLGWNKYKAKLQAEGIDI